MESLTLRLPGSWNLTDPLGELSLKKSFRVHLEVALREITLSASIIKSNYSRRVESYRMDCFNEALLKLLSVAAKYLREMNPLGELLEKKNCYSHR